MSTEFILQVPDTDVFPDDLRGKYIQNCTLNYEDGGNNVFLTDSFDDALICLLDPKCVSIGDLLITCDIDNDQEKDYIYQIIDNELCWQYVETKGIWCRLVYKLFSDKGKWEFTYDKRRTFALHAVVINNKLK